MTATKPARILVTLFAEDEAEAVKFIRRAVGRRYYLARGGRIFRDLPASWWREVGFVVPQHQIVNYDDEAPVNVAVAENDRNPVSETRPMRILATATKLVRTMAGFAPIPADVAEQLSALRATWDNGKEEAARLDLANALKQASEVDELRKQGAAQINGLTPQAAHEKADHAVRTAAARVAAIDNAKREFRDKLPSDHELKREFRAADRDRRATFDRLHERDREIERNDDELRSAQAVAQQIADHPRGFSADEVHRERLRLADAELSAKELAEERAEIIARRDACTLRMENAKAEMLVIEL